MGKDWLLNKEQELIAYIKELEAQGAKLVLEWDAGGDQTINNFAPFFTGSPKELPPLPAGVIEYFNERFDLPNVGDTYSKGSCMMVVNADEKVVCIMDEYRYDSDEMDYVIWSTEYPDEQTENVFLYLKEEAVREIPFTAVNEILKAEKSEALAFDGGTSIQFDDDPSFHISGKNTNAYVEHCNALSKKIQKHFETHYIGPWETVKIYYSGILLGEKVLFEHIELTEVKPIINMRATPIALFDEA